MTVENPWTADLIARLEALWDEGLSTAEIGRRMNISKNATIGKAHRLGLPARPSPIKSADPQRPVRIKRAPRVTLPGLAAPVAIPEQPAEQPRLNRQTCCFPLNDGPRWLFCDSPARIGSSYCPEHHAKCFVARGGASVVRVEQWAAA